MITKARPSHLLVVLLEDTKRIVSLVLLVVLFVALVTTVRSCARTPKGELWAPDRMGRADEPLPREVSPPRLAAFHPGCSRQ